MRGIVQLRQKVRGPRDGVRLPRPGRVLDQIPPAYAVPQYLRLQLPRHVELVIAGEDDVLDLLAVIALGDDVAPQDLQPALALPNLLPEVGGGVAGWVR